MNWSNVPSHIFDNIFSNSTVRERKVFSLVSRNWYREVAWSWKNYIELKCHRLEQHEDWKSISESERYFENLVFEECAFDKAPCELIKTITNRTVKSLNKVSSLSFYCETDCLVIYNILESLPDNVCLKYLNIDYPSTTK